MSPPDPARPRGSLPGTDSFRLARALATPPALFLLGLLLRLPGALFNGMADLYQILLDWGLGVWHRGLVATFGINYGVLSYAALGALAGWGERTPRFWWAPYKLAIVGFEAAVLVALLALVPARRRRLVLVLYWLNPWFILHGAYHGFWDAPHLVGGLLAVRALERARAGNHHPWAWVGGWLAVSGLFKPQGLVYFAGPLALYLAVQVVRGVRPPFFWFAGGWSAVMAATVLALRLAGGGWLALFDNYRSAFTTMSGISNGGPGIWRFVAFAILRSQGLDGPVHVLRLPRPVLATLTALAGVVCLALVAWFAAKVPLALPGRAEGERKSGTRGTLGERWFTTGLRPGRWQAAAGTLEWFNRRTPMAVVAPHRAVWLLFALAALVISQFGVRAHINHSYTAMVLLVPLAAEGQRVRRVWMAMCGLLGFAHLAAFRLGEATLLPPPDIWARYPAAGTLIDSIGRLSVATQPDRLLATQMRVNTWLEACLPGQDVVSLLSLAVFVCACLLVRELFAAAQAGTDRSS